jgi:CheY-like chemotaxis protein
MAKKILVVDDEPYMHRLLEHHLVRAGYELIIANNGREALDRAASEGPNLIIMDVMMKEMDGLTALKEMKLRPDTRNIPVIMMTTSAHILTRQASDSSGAAMFLTKPFSPTRLLSEIRQLLHDSEDCQTL